MKRLIIYISAIMIFGACEDPIEVTLNDAPSQVVIDAWITNISEPQTIKVTYSQPYFDSALASGIDNATVQIESDNGSVYVFQNAGSGEYTWTPSLGETIGNIGDSYVLDIQHEGETYSAVSTLNDVPPIDSIMQEFRDDEVFLDDGIYCQFFARDLVGLGDSYWIKTFKNDTFLNRATELNIAFDAAFDSGAEVDGIIFIPPIREYANATDEGGIPQAWDPGDKIRVEIHSITNSSFAYMEILRDQLLNSLNGIFAEPLANPIGNIETTGDLPVLGQFNVAVVSSIEEIIR